MTTPLIDDAEWMAYVDGGLDAPRRAAVEAAMAQDPVLAGRVAAQQALRQRLQRGLAAELTEPVPDRLRALLAPAPAAETAPALVLQGAGGGGSERNDPASPRGLPPQAWALAAAALALGLLGPRLLPSTGADLRIDGRLAQALEAQLVAEARPGAGDWQPRLSFKDADGRYCRAFSGSAQAGVACKGADERWALQVLVPAEAATGELRQAASPLPAAVLAAVDARSAGATLDAEAERKARAAGWK